MATSSRAPLIFPPSVKHTATFIFAHGLGDSGHGWLSVVENWRRRQRLEQVKFILPHAPNIPITCNGGMVMPGWFDIKVLGGSPENIRTNEDEQGMLATRAYLHRLIQQEVDAGIPPNRIVIGGFSQGGAMALLSGLSHPWQLGGIVGLSCWLLLGSKFSELYRESNHSVPIFMGHGTEDPLVALSLAKESKDRLVEAGFSVKMEEYSMGHSACPEEIDDVEAFLAERLPDLN